MFRANVLVFEIGEEDIWGTAAILKYNVPGPTIAGRMQTWGNIGI